MNKLDRNKNFWIFRLTSLIKRYSQNIISFTYIIIIITAITLDLKQTYFLLNFKTTVLDAISPSIQFINSELSNFKTTLQLLKELPNLRYENVKLKQENYLLTQQYNSVLHLKFENEQLHKLLHFANSTEFTYITTKVISNFTTPYTKSVLITVGKDWGVAKGQIIINNEGLVGRIQDVGLKTARVLLITDLHSRIPVLTLSSRERGIIKGNNSDQLNLIYLTENHNVTLGEVVVTSDDGKFFPPGLIVGTITEIKNGNITVTPAVNFNYLDTVITIGYPQSEIYLDSHHSMFE